MPFGKSNCLFCVYFVPACLYYIKFIYMPYSKLSRSGIHVIEAQKTKQKRYLFLIGFIDAMQNWRLLSGVEIQLIYNLLQIFIYILSISHKYTVRWLLPLFVACFCCCVQYTVYTVWICMYFWIGIRRC